MKKTNKLDRAAHIKNSTVGSSNEISMSVLDAAKLVMDERHGEARRIQQLGKINLFNGEAEPDYEVMTLSGDAGAADAPVSHSNDFEQRVIQKKANRKVRRGMTLVATALLAAVIIAAAVFCVGSYLSDRDAFSGSLGNILSQIKQTDDVVVDINQALENPTSDDSAKTVQSASKNIAGANGTLNNTLDQLSQLESDAASAQDKEAAAQAEKSAKGRIEMLKNAEVILADLKQAQDTIASIEKSKESHVSADDLARQAANLVAEPTDSNLNQAQSLLDQAVSLEQTAIDLAQQVSASRPDVDQAGYIDYLALKKSIYEQEKQAIEAILASDPTTARTLQESYTAAEQQARQSSASVEAVEQNVIAAYEKSASSAISSYEQARDQVAAADEQLRKYLGTS